MYYGMAAHLKKEPSSFHKKLLFEQIEKSEDVSAEVGKEMDYWFEKFESYVKPTVNSPTLRSQMRSVPSTVIKQQPTTKKRPINNESSTINIDIEEGDVETDIANEAGKKKKKKISGPKLPNKNSVIGSQFKSTDIPSLRKEDNETYNYLNVPHNEIEHFFLTASKEMINNNILDMLSITALESLHTKTSIKGNQEKLANLQLHFREAVDNLHLKSHLLPLFKYMDKDKKKLATFVQKILREKNELKYAARKKKREESNKPSSL
jgi:hypothetical protein